MSGHRLLLTASGGALANLSADNFLWRSDEPSSMESSLGPRLEALGPVPALHVDFVRLAALVFFADRTVPRRRDWVRELELDVPVSDPDRWSSHGDALADALNTLTGDLWTLSFSSRREPRLGDIVEPEECSRVVLFSGGADSASGAAIALGEEGSTVLVSHSDWQSIRGQQNRVLTALDSIFGEEPTNIYWRLMRREAQAGSGAPFAEEPSRRSRSVIFIALGLAVASMREAELWIPENGFTALNPPLSGERRGANSTRTAHPGMLDELTEVLDAVGLHVQIRNPFEELTKGEVFERVRKQLGDTDAQALLGPTNSCAKPGRERGFAPDAHCGVCLGCLVRRAAFQVSGVVDPTTYKERAMSGARRKRWMSASRRETFEALQYRIAVGFEIDDILDLGLPDRWEPDDALAVAQRGLQELGGVEIP